MGYAKFIQQQDDMARLKYINPEEGGNFQLFKHPPKFTTTSLKNGRL